MAHTLQLDVPDDIYESLVKLGEQTGQRPESVALEQLITATQHLADDPLEHFIGAFPSDIPDWADQHDKYIGQGSLERGHDGDGQGEARD